MNGRFGGGRLSQSPKIRIETLCFFKKKKKSLKKKSYKCLVTALYNEIQDDYKGEAQN